MLGKTTTINGESFNVIGVAPRSVEAIDARVQLFRPLAWPHDRINPLTRYITNHHMFGRLKPGVTIARARAEADMLERNFDRTALPPVLRMELNRSGYQVGVADPQTMRSEPAKSSLYLLQAGVVFVLLIGCVNIANLLLARANSRQAELSLLCALVATRGAIARHLLAQSLLLTGFGALLGLALARCGLGAINHSTALLPPNTLPFAIDGRVLGFTAMTSISVAVLVSFVPVVYVLGSNLTEMIGRKTRSASGGSHVRAVSSLLIVGQFGIALVLLAGAGLLIRSFANALAVDVGFDPRQIITGRIALPAAYRESDAAARDSRTVARRAA